MNKTLIFSNGVSLELDEHVGGFRGISGVSFRGTPLRSSRLPWTLYTESETSGHAVSFEDFLLEDVQQGGDEATLVLRSTGRWMPRTQSADAMGEARVRSRRLGSPQAVVFWRFRAISELIGDEEWHGLSMQVEYRCEAAPIHWLMETATWEIGGEAAGCVLIQQDVSAIQLEQEVRADSEFSTIEKFFTDGWGGSYPMDMMPRAAGASICDFQAKGDLALCLFSETPGMTRARLDKAADEDVIHYLDRAYFPLGTEVRAPERKLLVYKGDAVLARHEVRNLWLDCFTEVRRRILDHYGFQLEIPEPSSGGHLWDEELKERLEKWADPMERDIPEYARLGYKQLFFHGVWESITSDPNPPAKGNICCPYAFRFAESFGGAAGMKKISDVARAHGLRLMQWFSFHLSRYAPVWKDHPEWVLRQADGDPWDGSYQGLWSGRMRSAFAEDFQSQIEAVMDDTGINGIFWDSYHNLGVLAVDWGADDRAPQAEEIFRMQAALQRKGFRQWIEATTIFGVSKVAIFGFEDTKFRRRLWSDFVDGDQAFVLMDTSPSYFLGPEERLLTADRLSPQRYFWLAAHRVLPGLSSDPWERGKDRFPGGAQAEAYGRVNRLYNQALPRMQRLRLQEGGRYVLWLDEQGIPAVLWTFEDGNIEFQGRITDLEGEIDLDSDGRIFLQGGKVFSLAAAVGQPFRREESDLSVYAA